MISIDFVGSDVPMASTEVAGVVSRSNWNEAAGANGSGMTLVDENGTATTASVTWTSSTVYKLPILDTPGNLRMMKGYLDTVGQNAVVNVTGLPVNSAGYDIYVYADGANWGATRNGTYQISGPGITTTGINLTDAAKTNFSGIYTQANSSDGNFVKFTISGTGFTVTAIPGTGSDGTARAPINGMQIVPHGISLPDFSISASPSLQTLNPGGSTTYTVTLGAINGFTGTMTLSASGLSGIGTSASFSPPTITGSGTSTMTITTGSTISTGTSKVTITGTSGNLAHTTSVNFLISNATPGAGAISIDFVGSGVPMASTEIAGIVPRSNWNEAAGANGSGMALVDETGTTSTANLAWSSSSVFKLPTRNTPGNFRMMNGYLDTVGQNAIVTVTGLPANSTGYDIYVYADGANSGATRNSTYQISGAGITTTSINLTDAPHTNFSGTYVQANSSNGNFVQFTIPSADFTITAIPGTGSDGTARAPINGIQIIPR